MHVSKTGKKKLYRRKFKMQIVMIKNKIDRQRKKENTPKEN